MKKNRIGYKLIGMFFLIGFLMFCHTKDWQVRAESSIKITSAADGNFANVVVYVDFSDTDHNHGELSWGSCFKDNPRIEELFDGEAKPRSLTQYLKKISYNQLIVSNIFPQYDSSTGKVTPYTLNNNAQYYAENHDALVGEVVENLISSGKLSGVLLDRNGDTVLDNLMIVVPCESGVANTLFYGMASQYAGQTQINGVAVSYYNIVTESGAYLGISESGLLIHEFLHTLGYPDLYRNRSGDTAYSPVGSWDIMSVESHRVQYPLAYYRSAKSGWFDIPTVTSSKTSYKLVAASESTADNKNNQAVILKTSHSDSEFFVLEYRKKGDTYGRTEEGSMGYDEKSYDASIYGSGLIIYRINTNKTSNTEGGAWAAYVFRPGDSYDANKVELSSTTHIAESYLSSESGRTRYGSAMTTATLSDGAITYSDGTNSGIVISNVGSASGDTITFDITFTEQAAGDTSDWTLLTDGRSGEYTNLVGSFMDSDGTIYCVETDEDYTPGIYSFDGSNWSNVCDAPSGARTLSYQLGKYNQVLYCAYVDTGYYLHLAKRSGNGWSEVYKSSVVVNNFSLAADSYGLTLAFVDSGTNGTSNSVYAYVVNTSGGKAYTVRASGTYASNICATMINGTPYLAYREYNNGNKITVWSNASGTWGNLGSPCTGDVFDLTSDGQTLYLLASNGSSGGYCYIYDISAASLGWQKWDGSFSNDLLSSLKVCIQNGLLYVFYEESTSPYTTRVKGYANGTWTQIGSGVSDNGMNGMALYGKDETLYAVYCRATNSRTYIKKHAVLNVAAATTAITVDLPSGYDPNLYIDGIKYSTTYDSATGKCVVDPGNKSAKVITAYKLKANGAPSSMYVWTLSYQGTAYKVTPLPDFENILAYHGFSARITGKTGLRYVSSIATDLKTKLLQTGGVDGYVLKEYGVITLPESSMTKYPLVYNGAYVQGTVDFKVNSDGTKSEILFSSENGRDWFTGLLINIPTKWYKTNFAFRSYVILEKNGTQYIIYQLPKSRSLYDIANQYLDNNMYASGSAEYNYLKKIIADAN